MTDLAYFVVRCGEIKRIEEMTREELIEAVKVLGQELDTLRKMNKSSHRMYQYLLSLRPRSRR